MLAIWFTNKSVESIIEAPTNPVAYKAIFQRIEEARSSQGKRNHLAEVRH
jgi:hypothetical protein